MPKCRYCGYPIDFTTVKALGKPVAVEPDPVTAGECEPDDYLIVDGNITQAGMLKPETVGRKGHLNQCRKNNIFGRIR